MPGTIYDMDVDENHRFLLTAGKDRRLHFLQIETGKPINNAGSSKSSSNPSSNTMRVDSDGGGELIKVRLDPWAGRFAMVSCSDRSVRVLDCTTGDCVAKVNGHSEIVTSLCITPDCRHLISASGDGCIFIWRIGEEIYDELARLCPEQHQKFVAKQASMSLNSRLRRLHSGLFEDKENLRDIGFETLQTPTVPTGPIGAKDMEIGINEQLPTWAQQRLGLRCTSSSSSEEENDLLDPAPKVRGRWAQRLQQRETVPTTTEQSSLASKLVIRSGANRRRYTIENLEEDFQQQQQAQVSERSTEQADFKVEVATVLSTQIEEEEEENVDDEIESAKKETSDTGAIETLLVEAEEKFLKSTIESLEQPSLLPVADCVEEEPQGSSSSSTENGSSKGESSSKEKKESNRKGRRSLSSKFVHKSLREFQRKQRQLAEVNQLQNEERTLETPVTDETNGEEPQQPQKKMRREELAKEVERTRQRLAALGMLVQPRATKTSSDENKSLSESSNKIIQSESVQHNETESPLSESSPFQNQSSSSIKNTNEDSKIPIQNEESKIPIQSEEDSINITTKDDSTSCSLTEGKLKAYYCL
jgi:hypothetical protein